MIEVKLLMKPQCIELEPPEAAKEKQKSTLRCELDPENPSNWYLCL